MREGRGGAVSDARWSEIRGKEKDDCMIPHFLSCHVDLTLAIILSPIEVFDTLYVHYLSQLIKN